MNTAQQPNNVKQPSVASGIDLQDASWAVHYARRLEGVWR